MEGLKARGERKYDIMTDIFKAICVASDAEFFNYIKTKKDRYNNGEVIITEQIITAAINNYEFLLNSVNGIQFPPNYSIFLPQFWKN